MSLSEEISAQKASKVALTSCRSYEPLEVRAALRHALDLLDTPERFIRPGDHILVKPNMLSAREPEQAVTTHPELILAVGEMVLDCRGKIVLGDSPGGVARDISRYWQKTGIAEVAKRLNIKPVAFENERTKSFRLPHGYINISKVALEVDGIINLPKLKTHLLTRMTGAVKNMFGTVPGYRKGYLHSLAPQADFFAKFVLSVYQQVIPDLNIMDAVVGMEGNGPSSGNPRHIGALLVAEDALMLDSIAARIIGYREEELPLFKAAVEAGLWSWDHPVSDMLGTPLSELQIADFKRPDVSKLERIPAFIVNNLKKLVWIRPKADASTCTACSLCIESCPVEAMELKNDVPEIDYKTCIKCGCCDEVCPDNAIYQQMSLLAKILS